VSAPWNAGYIVKKNRANSAIKLGACADKNQSGRKKCVFLQWYSTDLSQTVSLCKSLFTQLILQNSINRYSSLNGNVQFFRVNMTLRIEHQSKLRTALFVNSSDMLPSGGVSTLHLVHDNPLLYPSGAAAFTSEAQFNCLFY